MDNKQIANCKKCEWPMQFDIRDKGAEFICHKCETRHSYSELIGQVLARRERAKLSIYHNVEKREFPIYFDTQGREHGEF